MNLTVALIALVVMQTVAWLFWAYTTKKVELIEHSVRLAHNRIDLTTQFPITKRSTK